MGEIATICGRYYAMDRDKRWDRVKLAYEALVHGEGLRAADALTAVRDSYARDETDEFILPTIVCDRPESRVGDEDGVVFFNFRPDRAREMTAALHPERLSPVSSGAGPAPTVDFVGMTEYDPTLRVAVAFPKEEPRHVLAEVISEAGLTQLHIAETEKYAHVTFFFNGGREKPFPGEVRRLIPSPKEVDTYDQKPAMSAYEVAECLRRDDGGRPGGFRGAQLRQSRHGGPHRQRGSRHRGRRNTSTDALAGSWRSLSGWARK